MLEIPFLTFSKVEIIFIEQKLYWKIYTLDMALLTTKRMQIINQNKFAAAALALDKEAFMVHMVYLKAKILIHLAREAKMALMLVKKINVPKEYADLSDVFFKKSVAMLFNCSNIYKHIIDVKVDKQPSYRYNHSLGPV